MNPYIAEEMTFGVTTSEIARRDQTDPPWI